MPPMEPKRNTRAMRKSPVLEPKSHRTFVEKCLLNQGTNAKLGVETKLPGMPTII